MSHTFPIVFVKLGGSLITNKSSVSEVKRPLIRQLGREIEKALTKRKNLRIVLSHGQGSFAHIPAKKYGTANGFTHEFGRLGACITANVAAEMNRIVVSELLSIGLPVATVAPSSIFTAKNRRPHENFIGTIETLLANRILSVLYGDVIWDNKKGCCIYSGEAGTGIVAALLKKKKYHIENMIQCGKEDGVYEWDTKKLIPHINRKNFQHIKQNIRGSESIDVTGGMLHKVEESLKLAHYGINTIILNGQKKNLLYRAILGEKVSGTKIS